MCKSGCNINEQCMNHVMYAAELSVSSHKYYWPSTNVGWDVCLNFSIRNDIIFDPKKPICVVFKCSPLVTDKL